jgi:deoxyxylulose-5-phosphate synthase
LGAAEILVKEFEIFANVMIPQVVSPLNLDFAFEVLKSSDIVYLVEEGIGATGLSGLLIQELNRLNLTLDLKLISGKGIVGASITSESAALISIEKIVKTVAARR